MLCGNQLHLSPFSLTYEISDAAFFFSLNAQSLSAEEERRFSACFEFVNGNLGNKLPLLPKRNNNNNY